MNLVGYCDYFRFLVGLLLEDKIAGCKCSTGFSGFTKYYFTRPLKYRLGPGGLEAEKEPATAQLR